MTTLIRASLYFIRAAMALTSSGSEIGRAIHQRRLVRASGRINEVRMSGGVPRRSGRLTPSPYAGELPAMLETHDAVIILDPSDQTVLAVNDRACNLYGFTRQTFVGMPMKAILKDYAGHQVNVCEALATRTYHDFETVQFRSDGSEMLLDVRASTVEYEGRTAILSVNRDVTERAALLRSIEASGAEWQQTVDVIDAAIVLLDPQQRVLRANRRAGELAGEHRRPIEGSFLAALGHAQPWRRASELAAGVLQGRSSRQITSSQITDIDGTTWDISAAVVRRPEGGGNVVVVARDITGIVDLEASLRDNETMAEMGRLLGGVAHEVRNPLFSISATSDAIEAHLNGDDPVMTQHLANFRHEIGRLNTLMHDLLDYGRPGSLVVHIGTLSEVASLAVRRVQKQAAERGVRIVNEISADGGRILMDRDRLSGAFENVLKNAISHSPAGESVLLRAADSEGEHGRWISFSVEDHGTGFRPEDLPDLFKAFFTRRAGGIGLGLSIVKRVIDYHGGRVIAENRAAGGASMTILLPAYAGE
jgi:PAS domain S-box-containing protein